ncbi:MAG: hypothetical protein HC921_16720 [Synechococcaceae cyanobacterium SM2_3_1]|nr:hypothetical protein [Synechococcaceae cyanobacterium SM2_3_1]
MAEIEDLETRVLNLSQSDFARFRDWFYQLENERWDQQIQSDFQSGRFDKLIENARQEFSQGHAREL